MMHLLKRGLLPAACLAALALASPAFAVDCTPATAPNTSGTTANATLETMKLVCDKLGGDISTYDRTLLAGEDLTNNVLGTISKPVVAATYARSADVSFSSLVTHNTKAAPALLFAFRATNTNAAVRYFQAYNSTGSTTGTPVYSEPIAAGSATAPGSLTLSSDFFGLNGSYFSVGLTWAISTTAATYTAATAADHTVNVQFK